MALATVLLSVEKSLLITVPLESRRWEIWPCLIQSLHVEIIDLWSVLCIQCPQVLEQSAVVSGHVAVKFEQIFN